MMNAKGLLGTVSGTKEKEKKSSVIVLERPAFHSTWSSPTFLPAALEDPLPPEAGLELVYLRGIVHKHFSLPPTFTSLSGYGWLFVQASASMLDTSFLRKSVIFFCGVGCKRIPLSLPGLSFLIWNESIGLE